MIHKPFRYYVRVRYQDCDAQHVVFNARYGDYVDLACTEFLKACMPGRNLFDGDFEFMLARQLIEWKGPARFDDVVEVSVAVAKFGTTSFTLRFELRKAGHDAIFATAETVNVHVDGKTWAKTPITRDVRAMLENGAPGVQTDHAGFLPRAVS